MLVQIKKLHPGVLVGARTYSHADGPVELDETRAKLLLEHGLADPVTTFRSGSKAVNPKLEASTR